MKKTVVKIIWYIIGAFGLVASIFDIFNVNNITIRCLIAGIIILITVLIAIYDRLILLICPVHFLRTKEDVYNFAQKLVTENDTILFCGKLDDNLLEIFKKAFEKKSVGQSLFRMNIFNTDPRFYSAANLKQVESVLKMDTESENFNHKFYFYRQNVNLLQGDTKGKDSLILFFQNSNNDYNGVYIRNGSRLKIDDLIIENACPTVNIVGQLDNVQSVAEKSLEFWTPLKNGWFHPVFPPDDNAEVRKAWRDSLMSWFNSTASDFLNKGGGKLTITWKIQEWSEKDAERFKTWLNKLKSITKGQNIEVTRYMLIDVEKYKLKPNYKKVVDSIVTNYLPSQLPRSSGDPYQIYFINRNKLPTSLDDDFALFLLGNGEKVAQNSLIDTKEGVEVLRVVFSKDFNFVKSVEDKISRITTYNPRTTLNDLVE